MLLPEIIETIIRADSAGVFTDENKLDRDYMAGIVHKARATAIGMYWQKNNRVNPVWLQKYIPAFSGDLQEDGCMVKFKMFPFISLDDKTDGLLYVGSVGGNVSYTKVTNRAELANYTIHRFTKPKEDKATFIYSEGFIEIYGNKAIRSVRADAIFMNPAELPTFNSNYDDYPITLDLFQVMQQVIFPEQQRISGKPADTKSDSQDTIATVNK